MRYGNNISIQVNDISISYNCNGTKDAPVIIFIHGFPLNKSMWDNQVEALKENYNVLAYDIRGHGNSEIGSGEFSIDIFVQDLICMINILKLKKVILCGLSMGGYVALRAVKEYPEYFEAMILCDTQCKADSVEEKAKRLASIENIKNQGMETYADGSLKNLFAPESFFYKKGALAAVKEMILNTSEISIFKTIHALAARKETCSHLKNINIPVLILVGNEDKITPPDTARLLQENIKLSKLRIINNAGHLSNLEYPEEFNCELGLFLREYSI